MNLLHISRFVLLASMAFMGLAHASPTPPPTWININISPDGDFVVSFKNQSYDLNISPTPTGDSFFYNANIQDQSAANILQAVQTQYNLPSGTLNEAGYCDKTTSFTCSHASLTNFTTPDGDPGVTFAGDPFNYLAIHMGNGELFFSWSLAVDAVTLTGDLSRISNYRSYLDPSVVPLPGAALLFASGLGALGLFGRRRSRVAKATPALI